MKDKPSLIVKRRDYTDIAKLQEPGVLEAFLDEPLTFITETITGLLAGGRTGAMVSGGRLVQAVLKAKLFEQWAKEFKTLRDKGRIPDDFANKKYGFQTWAELMMILDEESPDEDRLEALKAMFLAVNRVESYDYERVAAYQLWLTTKQLTSGELLLLKAAYAQRLNYQGGDGYSGWRMNMAAQAGHRVEGLVDMQEKRLTDLCMLTERQHGDRSGILKANARLTDFGIQLCRNIETYNIEIKADG